MTSENLNEEKKEILQTSLPASQQVELRLILHNTGYAEGKADLAYRKPDGSWENLIDDYVPDRHTWVGVRVGLFAMSVDGVDHGGYADFGSFRVETE